MHGKGDRWSYTNMWTDASGRPAVNFACIFRLPQLHLWGNILIQIPFNFQELYLQLKHRTSKLWSKGKRFSTILANHKPHILIDKWELFLFSTNSGFMCVCVCVYIKLNGSHEKYSSSAILQDAFRLHLICHNVVQYMTKMDMIKLAAKSIAWMCGND